LAYVETDYRAFKAECYWHYNGKAWELCGYEGVVYQESGRFWLKTPTGFVEVFEKDFVI
tara:strand:+ start:1154 stop:1330 length:177 start_codon:yes stop_codon:yes gene_type:complete